MTKTERERAKRAGVQWANGYRGGLPANATPAGPLPAFDALAHLGYIGDTGDPDQRRAEMKVANDAALARWKDIVRKAAKKAPT